MKNLTRALISVSTAGVLIGGAGYGVAAAGTSYENSDHHSHSKSDDSDDDGDSDGDHHGDHDSVEGDGSFALAKRFVFKGRTTSADPRSATGYFKADPISPADAVLALRGPITCLVVSGNRAGFLYPIKDDSKPFLIKDQFVMISLEDGGPGGKDHVGFVGPAPAVAFPNCNPGPTPFEVTSGDVKVHDGS